MKNFTQTLIVVFMAVAMFSTVNGQTVKGTLFQDAVSTGDWSIGGTGESLEIREPEESNKVWATFQDDWGLKLTGAPNLQVNGYIGMGRQGIGGTYNSTQVQGIWSISPSYKISTSSNNFGTQYGIAYAHTNAGTGSKKPLSGFGHQIVYTSSGTVNSAISLSYGHAYFKGNVGIGTTSSGAKLKAYGSSNPYFEFASSVSKLQIGAATSGWAFAHASKAGDIVFRPMGGNDNHHGMIFYLPNDNNDGNSYIKFGDDANNLWMGIFNNRTVRIDGILYSNEIRVQTDVWSDFVFEKDYNLKTLEEVEDYINKNKHLPDVPSESEIFETGVNIAEMNAILLQKIEELTLYILEQDKRIKSLEDKSK
jgi:hypothetical protein